MTDPNSDSAPGDASSSQEPLPSSLDQSMIDTRRAAEAGSGEALLDDSHVNPDTAQHDDAPLVASPPDDLLESETAATPPARGKPVDAPALASARSQLEALIDEVAGMEPAWAEPVEASAAPSEAPEPEAEPELPAPTADADAGLLSQDALDTLLADDESRQAVVRPPGQEKAVEIPPQPPRTAAPPSPPPAAAPESAETLTSEDIDALLAAVDGDKGDSATSTQAGQDTVDPSLIDALLSEISSGTAPRRAAPAQPLPRDVPDIEQPLGGHDDEALDSHHPDTPVTVAAPEVLSGPANQADIDALIASLSAGELPSEPVAPLAQTAGGSGPVDQAMIDALIAGAAGEPLPTPEVGKENLAAAATSQDKGLLSQSDLDALIEQALKTGSAGSVARDRAMGAAAPPPPITSDAPPSVPQETEPKPRRRWVRRPPDSVSRFVRTHFFRLAASLVVGLLAAMGTFTALYRNQERLPDLAALSGPLSGRELESLYRRAQERFAAADYDAALDALERLFAAAPPGALRTDAEYLRAEAVYKMLPTDAPPDRVAQAITEIERVVEGAHAHPRAPLAFEWKAVLHERLDHLSDAQAAYDQIIDFYADAPNLETALKEAARIALARKKAQESVEYARRLIQQFPDSDEARAAQLLIADAYSLAGMTDEARTLYARTAESEAGTMLGAEAYQRLGELALSDRRYSDAIRYLESRLQTATTTEGNDRIYLELARAYHAAGRYEDARNTLNDLISFFPESSLLPDAFVDLTGTLDALGLRDDALRVAQQAAVRFPDNPETLKNAGEIYGLAGRPGPAAEMLMAADLAGAADPSLLLTAGRHFKTAGRLEEAFKAFDDLRNKYSRSPQAVTGGIEGASVLYELGQVTEAVDRLEALMMTTEGTPQHLPALAALSRIYHDLGLRDQVAELALQASGSSAEPEVLAQAAVDLFRAGRADEASQVAGRTDLTKLTAPTAYALLTAQGSALLKSDANRAVEKLEQAALSYPEARRPDGDVALLEAYVRTGRRAAARRVAMELEAHVSANPVDASALARAAVVWGDYLFEIGDMREAESAYALALGIAKGPGELDAETSRNIDWAKYQRANVLLQMSDYSASLPLFEEVAQSSAPWAAEAALKAEYAKVERRLRGETSAG